MASLPWEQQVWRVGDGDVGEWGVTTTADDGRGGTFEGVVATVYDESAARLIAAAPDMARALLALDRFCSSPHCGACKTHKTLLDTALRKAGIR